MNKSKLFLIILMTAVVSTYTTYQLIKNIFITEEQSIPQSGGFQYRDFFTQEDQPDWRDVQIDGFFVSVPYSPDWKIGEIGLSVYDVHTTIENDYSIIFGRAIDGGTYMYREYVLSRGIKKNIDVLMEELTNGCNPQIPAKLVTIEGIHGVQYYIGGAKGCSTGFAFNKGNYTYNLTHIPNFGELAPEITDEMKKIIGSVS